MRRYIVVLLVVTLAAVSLAVTDDDKQTHTLTRTSTVHVADVPETHPLVKIHRALGYEKPVVVTKSEPELIGIGLTGCFTFYIYMCEYLYFFRNDFYIEAFGYKSRVGTWWTDWRFLYTPHNLNWKSYPWGLVDHTYQGDRWDVTNWGEFLQMDYRGEASGYPKYRTCDYPPGFVHWCSQMKSNWKIFSGPGEQRYRWGQQLVVSPYWNIFRFHETMEGGVGA